MTELQKLEQQVAELQATIERMKEPEPIKQWEPQGGEWWVNFGDVTKDSSEDACLLFGLEYKTKEQAEWASIQMRKFNRLLCYVAEFDVDENGVQWIPDWNNTSQAKCNVAYSRTQKEWFYDTWWVKEVITVFMSTECAKGLVDKLNSGEVVL